MSRYIDADAMKELYKPYESYNGKELAVPIGAILANIDDAPSIDIVFCKECKHWERLNYEAPKEGWCDDEMPYSDGRWVDADDFCSYGERNE